MHGAVLHGTLWRDVLDVVWILLLLCIPGHQLGRAGRGALRRGTLRLLQLLLFLENLLVLALLMCIRHVWYVVLWQWPSGILRS